MIFSDNKSFAVCLTHDVDRVDKLWFHSLYYDLLKNKGKINLQSSKRKNPYWNFEFIMDLEKKLGVRSTFFFLNETIPLSLFRPAQWKLSLGRYSLREKRIQKIIRDLDSGGWEIGLHGSYNSYQDQNLLKKEKQELESVLGGKIWGIRQHYLNLDIPETWRMHWEIGLKYDSSFGFNRDIGFKDNIYRPFKPLENKFMVLPLALMDICLFSQSNDYDEIWNRCLKIIDKAEEKKAVLTVLWHQRAFDKIEFPGYILIYKKLIEECKNRNAWFCLGKDICRKFRDKEDNR